MMEKFRDAMYSGIGILSLTKEKVKTIKDELVKKGELSKDEGKKFIEALNKQRKSVKERIDVQIENKIKSILTNMDFATKDDLDKISLKLEEHFINHNKSELK